MGSPVASASSSRVASRPSSTSSRRAARESYLEPACGARELLLALDNVNGHANRARMVGYSALHGLADPPRRVGRELEAAAPVELLDRAVEAERAFLNQVEEGDTEAAIALGDRNDETQVRLDHAALGDRVAALDALGEGHLIGRGQQPVLTHVREEELQTVGGARELRHLDGNGLYRRDVLAGGRGRTSDFDADPLELAHEIFDLDLGKIVLNHERLDLGRLDRAALLSGVHEDADALTTFKHFLQVILRQLTLDVLSFHLAPR